MSYFNHFGAVWHKFADGSTFQINNLTKFAAFNKIWIDDPRAQMKYEIKDGELPHMISHRLYDTVDYWWTILLVNQIYDFENQWPRTADQFDSFLKDKYPFNDMRDTRFYLHPNGTVCDPLAIRVQLGLNTDQEAIDAVGLTPVTIYNYEMALNDHKKKIILIDPDYIATVASEFERLMKNG